MTATAPFANRRRAQLQHHEQHAHGVENAAEVRDRVLEHLKRYRSGSGLGDPEDELQGRIGLATPDVLAELAALREAARGMRMAVQGWSEG